MTDLLSNNGTYYGTIYVYNTVFSDGLTVLDDTGSGPGTIVMPDYSANNTMNFIGTQTFSTGIVQGVGTVSVPAASTLTIGSGVTFAGSQAALEFHDTEFVGAGSILNQGTIIQYGFDALHFPTIAAGQIGIQVANFENWGVIDSVDLTAAFFGGATTAITSATFTNHAGGVIELAQSLGTAEVTIAASTAFTNDGTLLTQDDSPNQPGRPQFSGGTIDIAPAVAGNGTIALKGNGVVELHSAVSSAQTLDFIDEGTLVLDQPASVLATIDGFVPGDIVRLGVAATPLSYSSGDLKLQTDGGTIDLALTGQYTLSDFAVSTQGTATTIQAISCFASGTRLATTRGAIRVERLHEGDLIVLANVPEALPIAWIGHRTVDCRRHPTPHRVWPVRIAAGAFGSETPERDLYLSPDHAVFVHDVLIPVKCLINGRTISQMAVDRITYWHVELPRHAVLRAEGLAVESLLPGGDRLGFANAAVVALYPDFLARQWESEGCAPLVLTGPEVEAVREMLACRTLCIARSYRSPRPRLRTARLTAGSPSPHAARRSPDCSRAT